MIGVDAIVHLAGEPVAEKRWTDRADGADSRYAGAGHAAPRRGGVAHGARIKAFVHGSAIGFYGDRADETLHADSAKGTGFLADVVEAWEAELRPLTERRPDVRVAIVRTGIVLAPAGRRAGEDAAAVPGVRRRKARQRPAVDELDPRRRHRALFVHALDSPAAGVLEGVAPQAVTNREFTNSLCRSLRRRCENAPVPAARDPGALRRNGRRRPGKREDRAAPDARVGVPLSGSSPSTRRSTISLTPLRGSTREKVSEQWVPHAPEEVWPFFCDERNLEELTPGFLQLRGAGQVDARDRRRHADRLSPASSTAFPSAGRAGSRTGNRLGASSTRRSRARTRHWQHAHEFIPWRTERCCATSSATGLPLRMAGIGGRRLERRVAGRPDLFVPRGADRRAIRRRLNPVHTATRMSKNPGAPCPASCLLRR